MKSVQMKAAQVMQCTWFALGALLFFPCNSHSQSSVSSGALLRELPSKPAWSTLAFLVQEAQDRSAAKEQNEAEAMKRKLEAVWYSPALLHGASTSDQRSGTRQCKAAEDKLQEWSVAPHAREGAL